MNALLLLLVLAIPPKGGPDIPRGMPKDLPMPEKYLVLDVLELKADDKAKEWAYTLTFTKEPDGLTVAKYVKFLVSVMEDLEEAGPTGELRTKVTEKVLTVRIKAKKAPEKPVLMRIERRKADKDPTFIAQFTREPDQESTLTVGQHFLELAPTPLLLKDKAEGEWTVALSSFFDTTAKTARYTFTVKEPKDD
jgi:hypothetical protein